MKLSQELIEEIARLRSMGLTSREVAFQLGIGKTTVNKYSSKQENNEPNLPNIAIIDTETSAALGYCFGRWDIRMSEDHIKEEGGKILVSCYKWLGDEKIHRLWMTPEEIAAGDDRAVTTALYDVYKEADAVVMHNAKKFDHKVIQTRALVHGLGALPIVKVIDTLEIAKKKLRLPSNALDSIGAYFGLGRKIDTGGISLWKSVQEGDVQAMQNMVDYCHQDVNLLELVFLKLAPLGLPGFNAAHYVDDDLHRCKVCASENVLQTGKTVKLEVGEYAEYQCHNCGHHQRGRQLLNTQTKRNSLLS